MAGCGHVAKLPLFDVTGGIGEAWCDVENGAGPDMLKTAIAMLAVASAAPALAQQSDALRAYAEKTSVEPRCRAPRDGEISVCARRNGDEYRLPYIEYDAGDPDHAGVPAERAALIAQKNNCEEMRAVLVGCGMVGVSVGASFGPGAKPKVRPLAP